MIFIKISPCKCSNCFRQMRENDKNTCKKINGQNDGHLRSKHTHSDSVSTANIVRECEKQMQMFVLLTLRALFSRNLTRALSWYGSNLTACRRRTQTPLYTYNNTIQSISNKTGWKTKVHPSTEEVRWFSGFSGQTFFSITVVIWNPFKMCLYTLQIYF